MKVSIIIPTLNEALILKETLDKISRLDPHEIIVADGGSLDTTVPIAKREATRVVECKPNRALQMNVGAREATGDLLLFIHADSRVNPESYHRMIETMRSSDLVGGAFSLTIESEKISLKLISRLATLRARHLNLVYGDQSIFVRADVFRKLDGYSPLPICEDLDFFRRLSQRGQVTLLKEKAYTSARRWMSEGIPFTTLRNIIIATLFLIGFPPRILSRWYQVIR
jgi:rSAM/selenodomain-associated transferase 2